MLSVSTLTQISTPAYIYPLYKHPTCASTNSHAPFICMCLNSSAYIHPAYTHPAYIASSTYTSLTSFPPYNTIYIISCHPTYIITFPSPSSHHHSAYTPHMHCSAYTHPTYIYPAYPHIPYKHPAYIILPTCTLLISPCLHHPTCIISPSPSSHHHPICTLHTYRPDFVVVPPTLSCSTHCNSTHPAL